MKKIIITIIALIILLVPINSYAISKNYVDKVADIVNVKVEKDKINLYLFYGKECPHCEDEREWLKNGKVIMLMKKRLKILLSEIVYHFFLQEFY